MSRLNQLSVRVLGACSATVPRTVQQVQALLLDCEPEAVQSRIHQLVLSGYLQNQGAARCRGGRYILVPRNELPAWARAQASTVATETSTFSLGEVWK